MADADARRDAPVARAIVGISRGHQIRHHAAFDQLVMRRCNNTSIYPAFIGRIMKIKALPWPSLAFRQRAFKHIRDDQLPNHQENRPDR